MTSALLARGVLAAAVAWRRPTCTDFLIPAFHALKARYGDQNHVLDPDIPEDVRGMIQRHLATMDHVELLMILRSGRDDSFALPRLVQEMRKPQELIELCLQALEGAGLAAQLSDGTYRYAARDEALDRTADEVVRLYNERPVTLVRLLYERPPTAINTFADAFKLRKDA